MYLKVGKGNAERIRKMLISAGNFDISRKVMHRGEYVFFPVRKKLKIPGTKVAEIKGKAKKRKPRSLKEALEGILTGEELKFVPTAFDVIGDIAVLEIPDELKKKEKTIAETLLRIFKNIRVVAKKRGSVEHEYRTRTVKVIGGEKRTQTVHREYGCFYKLDVSRAYFSPRLGTERMRIASKVRKNERVLVMFAGVGPYAILIAKNKKPKEVVAVELNPDAVRFMDENIKLNKVDVKSVRGDAKKVTPKLGKFDRIVMPLPLTASDFLDVALPALKKNGTIHFYDFAHTKKEAEDKVKPICDGLGHKIKILETVRCGSYSPCLSRFCVDFKKLA